MAHARVSDKDARVIEQCAQGRRVRYTESTPIMVATARTNNTDPNSSIADVIRNTSANKGVFIAPCAAKVVRIYTNAISYADHAAGGSSTVKLTKAVIGDTDVDLCSTIAIGAATAPTAETAIDATLSTTSGALDLVEGQLVYAVIACSDHDLDARPEGLIVCVEWVPMDGA